MITLLAARTRCLCLGRVSTKHQAGPDKTSLAQQAEVTRAFAVGLGKDHGFGEAAIEVREDPGVSGLDPERLEEIVQTCERAPRPKSAPGFVVVFDMSRFTRLGAQAAMFYLERLSRAGWTLRDTTLRLSGNDMSDAIQVTVASEVAAELIRGFHRKVFPAMAKQADKGQFVGGKAPLGYEVADKRLVPGDPADRKKVRAAFTAYVKGATLDECAEILGLKHASGARAVLANPAYVGDLVWGRRNGSHYKGKKEGAHTAIVDRAIWERAQERLRSRGAALIRIGRTAPKGALPYVLSKLVTCSCGRKLVGGGGVPRDATEEDRLRWRSYQCKSCRGSVRQAALETAVVGAMAKALREADGDGKLDRWMGDWVRDRLATSSREGVAKERTDLEAKRARLVRAIAETDDDGLVTALRDVKTRLLELDATVRTKPDAKAIKQQATEALRQTRAFVKANWPVDQIDPRAANQALTDMRPYIAHVEFDRETRLVEVTFTWHRTTETVVAEGRGRRGGGTSGPATKAGEPMPADLRKAIEQTARTKKGAKGHTSGYNAPWRARASRRAARRRI